MKKARVFCLLCVIVLMFSGCGGNPPSAPDPKETTAPQIDYIEIQDSKNVYTVKVPAEWDNSTEGNKRIITQKETGCEICIVASDFTPYICNTTQGSLEATASSEGKSLTSFMHQRGNIIDYTVEYWNAQEASMFELRRLCWSHTKIYNIYYKAETKYYDTFLDVFKAVLESFQPTDKYKIDMAYEDLWDMDENVAPLYLSDIGVYCEYPIYWTKQDFDYGATFTDSETGSVITISYTDAIPYFKTCTELQYLDLLIGNNGYDMSLTNYYNNGTDRIDGELIYAVGGTPYYLWNVMGNMGYATLLMTYESMQTVADMHLSTFDTFLNSVTIM